MVKVVYCFDAASMAICQNPLSDPGKKTSCSNQAFYGLLYLEKHIGVFLGSDIEPTEVNAKVQTTIFLAH